MVDNLCFLFDLVLQVSLVESLHSISPSPPRPSRSPFDCERASTGQRLTQATPSAERFPSRSSISATVDTQRRISPALAFTSLLDSDPASATSQGHFSPTTLGQVGFDLHFNRSDSLRDWFTAAPFSSRPSRLVKRHFVRPQQSIARLSAPDHRIEAWLSSTDIVFIDPIQNISPPSTRSREPYHKCHRLQTTRYHI